MHGLNICKGIQGHGDIELILELINQVRLRHNYHVRTGELLEMETEPR